MRIKNRKKIHLIYITVLFMTGLGLVVFGAWKFLERQAVTNNPRPKIETQVITRTIERPDETPLEDKCAEYKVESHYPERLAIPAIDASGCIERVGLDEKGAIAVPSSIYTAGWYVDSALPGQPGLSIIDGHISGYYNTNGIFQMLYKLRAGNEFTLQLGSGDTIRYKVTSVRSVPLKDAAKVMMERDVAIESQLNLITCGGNYDKTTKLYDKRIIVTSKLVATGSSST